MHCLFGCLLQRHTAYICTSFAAHRLFSMTFVQSGDKVRQELKSAKEQHAKVCTYLDDNCVVKITRARSVPTSLWHEIKRCCFNSNTWRTANPKQELSAAQRTSRKLEQHVNELKGLLADRDVCFLTIKDDRFEPSTLRRPCSCTYYWFCAGSIFEERAGTAATTQSTYTGWFVHHVVMM